MTEEQSTILRKPQNSEKLSTLRTAYDMAMSAMENHGIYTMAPEIRGDYDAWYMYQILDAVLNKGYVNSFELSRELAGTAKGSFNVRSFETQFGTVQQLVDGTAGLRQ